MEPRIEAYFAMSLKRGIGSVKVVSNDMLDASLAWPKTEPNVGADATLDPRDRCIVSLSSDCYIWTYLHRAPTEVKQSSRIGIRMRLRLSEIV